MAAELRIGEIFTKFYSELYQKNKLPDSGKDLIYNRELYNNIEKKILKAKSFVFLVVQKSSASSINCWELLPRFTPARWPTTRTNSSKPIEGSLKNRCDSLKLNWLFCHSYFCLHFFLQMTSTTNKPKLIVVAGCFRGITSLMVNFTNATEEGQPGRRTRIRQIVHIFSRCRMNEECLFFDLQTRRPPTKYFNTL